MSQISKAAQDVLAERERQRQKWGDDHDDAHSNDELANGAVDYLLPGQAPMPSSWAYKSKVKDREPRRDQLVKGAALALAAVEHYDRTSLLRLAQSNGLVPGLGDVHKHVPMTAAWADKKAPHFIDFGIDGPEHDAQAAGTTGPHEVDGSAPYCAKLAAPCPDGCATVQLTGCGGGTAGDCWRVKQPFTFCGDCTTRPVCQRQARCIDEVMAAWDAQQYRCKKCGYQGPLQINHQRPNGTGECGYIAARVSTSADKTTTPDADPAEMSTSVGTSAPGVNVGRGGEQQ